MIQGTGLFRLWGSGRGPVVRRKPLSRVLGGSLVFLASLVAPVDSYPGVAMCTALTVAWLASCRPPARILAGFMALALVLFLPVFLLTPWVRPDPGESALGIPWGIALHGTMGLLLSAATLSTLTVADLRDALLEIRVPRVIVTILVQMVQQASSLTEETHRMRQAIMVRGAAGSVSDRVRLAGSMVTVWVPRLLYRADRVAMAMELRGYALPERTCRTSFVWSARDTLLLVGTFLALGLAVLLRLGVVG